MKHMWNRVTALALAAVLCFALTACGGQAGSGSSSGSTVHTAQEYADAIKAARSEEENQYNEIAGRDKDAAPKYLHNPNNLTDEDAASAVPFLLEMMGLADESLDAYAVSVSLMNVRAYAVGVFRPAEGKTDEVKTALEEYLKLQRQSFENYLEDQYVIAKAAKIETLSGGELVLVMAEDSDAILESLKKAL